MYVTFRSPNVTFGPASPLAVVSAPREARHVRKPRDRDGRRRDTGVRRPPRAALRDRLQHPRQRRRHRRRAPGDLAVVDGPRPPHPAGGHHQPARLPRAHRREPRARAARRDHPPPRDVRGPLAAGAAARRTRPRRLRRRPGPAVGVGVAGDARGPRIPHPTGTGGLRPQRGVRLRPHGDRGGHRPQPRGGTTARAPRTGTRARPPAALPGPSTRPPAGDRALRRGGARRGHRRADGDPRAGRHGVDGRRRQGLGRAAAGARPGQGGAAVRRLRHPARHRPRPPLPARQRRRLRRALRRRVAVRGHGHGPHGGR